MKKKEQSKSRKVNNDSNDFRSLNSELGDLYLEPPKHYRDSKQSSGNNKKKKSVGKKTTAPDQKRIAQKKRRKRSKLFYTVISSVSIVLGIVIILAVLSLTVFFKIDTIKVNGSKTYSTQEISAVLPISKEKNLFLADTKEAKQKLEENLPYIYNAEIKRKLPSTILINIIETPKVYAIKNGDKTFTLVDQNFKVLELNVKKKPDGAVTVTKLKPKSASIGKPVEFEKEQKGNDLLAMTALIDKLKLDEITAIYSVDINNNYMIYEGRITFKLGTTENLESKVYSALTAVNKLNESDPSAKGTITSNGGKQIYFTEK